jgi:hypothetical protein
MVRKSPLQLMNEEIHNHNALKIGIKLIETLCQEKTLIDTNDSNARNYSKKRNLDPVVADIGTREEFFPEFERFLKSKGAKQWKSTYADCFKNFTAMINALKADTTALYTAARGFADDSVACYERVFFSGIGKKRSRDEAGYGEAANDRCNRFFANYTSMKPRLDDVAAVCETLRLYRTVFSRYGLD